MRHCALFIALMFFAASCTYTISMAHTSGTADDVIDDTSTPTATVTPTVNIPVKGIVP